MIYVVEDINMRPYMEDYHNIKINLYNGYDYIGIYDGHSTDQVSLFLKFHFKNFIVKHLEMNKHPANALMAAFAEAHAAMPIEMSFTAGSAAIVILRKNKELWIANCGDCRAIISSYSHKVLPLSIDHKPNRQDEFDRIKNLGGIVTFNPNDVPRVQGNLALSRSLGDKYLAPFVIPVPEIQYFQITEDNQYIVMASDGLWDVYSNEDVINSVVNTAHNSSGSVYGSSSVEFANKLIRNACLDLLNGAKMRGSGDNITIIFWQL